VLYDLTVGLGGHARAFLERATPDARVFGIDGDPRAIELAEDRLSSFMDRVTLLHSSLHDLEETVSLLDWPKPRIVLMDVGLSSAQIEDPERGMSYRIDGPLDMRFDPTRGESAAEYLLRTPAKELAHVLRLYADEPHADRVARRIRESLPITTTFQLAKAVLEAYGGRKSKLHPARRVFQAIRIAVNKEIESLDAGLQAALKLVLPGGRIIAICYHSLEDRLVKHTFREVAKNGPYCLITKRPIMAEKSEVWENPRARSAKLRVIEKKR
jgi:16S rRNA (cytosine1402-N4)-methyltransferase